MSAEQPGPSASAAGRQQMISDLHELVEAIDRRVPHPDRADEGAIAHDAADLKKDAEARIAQLAESDRSAL